MDSLQFQPIRKGNQVSSSRASSCPRSRAPHRKDEPMASPEDPPPPPPPGFDFSETRDWKGYLQWNLNVALIVFSTVFMILRLSTRAFIVKALGWDDLLGFIAYAVLISFSSLEIRCSWTLALFSSAWVRLADEFGSRWIWLRGAFRSDSAVLCAKVLLGEASSWKGQTAIY